MSISIKEGEFVTLVGPSGCGKTTMLKLINGLKKPDSGKIYIRDKEISEWDKIDLKRNIGYVIQQIGLLPHMTVSENISYVLNIKNAPKKIRNEKASELIKLKKAAKIFSEAGFDAIEISGGGAGGKYGPCRTKIHSKEQEAYHKKFASSIAEEVSVPIILVGGIRSLEVAEEILKETKIQAIALSRPMLREPKLIKRWLEGDEQKSKCISCNRCFSPHGIECIFNK